MGRTKDLVRGLWAGAAIALLGVHLALVGPAARAVATCTVSAVGGGHHVEVAAGEGETVAVAIDDGPGSPGQPFQNDVRGQINVSTLDPSTGMFSPFRLCAGDADANIRSGAIWLSLAGTQDAEESFVLWYAQKVESDDAVHVEDTVDDLTLNFGAIASPPYPVAADFLYDMDLLLATARDGTLVGATNTLAYFGCNLVLPGSATLTVVGGSDPYHLSWLSAQGPTPPEGDPPPHRACLANDVVDGTTEDDVPAGVKAYTGDLTYWGGVGRGDSFDPGTGTAIFMGGDGLNSLGFQYARRGVEVDLRAGTASGWGIQTFSGVVDVYGSAHDDVIIGSEAANWLFGLEGDDRLRGGAGDDRLNGAENDDRLQGGAGNDLLEGAQGASDVCIGGAGDDEFVRCETRRQ